MALRHDAFTSYSHAADGKLAAALERGLEKIAKPLLRLRALDVFRDQTSLTASPALWPGIVAHLSVSEWFLLLASPASAASVWCNKEVKWWLDNRSPDRLLVLLTEGDIFWDGTAQDFDWSRTTAMPRILERRCEDEPLYVDLRWARGSELLTLQNARFREAVVDVAAPLRGMPKDELDGADLRQLKRNRLLVRGGIAAISVAAAVAIWQAIVANQQKVEAERQRDIAVARQLGAQAELIRTQQPNRLPLALLMATESARLQPTSIEAQQTLRGVLSQFPLSTAVLPHSSGVTWTVFSDELGQLATAAADGTGALWKLPEATRITSLAGADDIVAFSPGQQRIAGCCRQVGVWNRSGAEELALSPSDLQGPPENIAFSADGRLLAIGVGGNRPGFSVYDLDTKQALTRHEIESSGNATAIAFAPNGDLLFAPRDKIEVYSGGTWQLAQPLDPGVGPVHRLAMSADGRHLAASGGTQVTVFDVAKRDVAARLQARSDGPGTIEQLGFDAKGLYLGAVGSLDTGAIWKVGSWREVVAVSHGEFQTIHSLAFDPSAPEAVSCGTDGCLGWSLVSGRKVHQFGHVYAHGGADTRRGVQSSAFASQKSVLVSGGDDGTARLWELSPPGGAGSTPCEFEDLLVHTFVANARSWNADGAELSLLQRSCSPAHSEEKGRGKGMLSPTGYFAAVDVPIDTARVWDTRTGKVVALLAHTDAVDWNAREARMRNPSNYRTYAFEVQRMQESGSVSVRAVSPSGKRVATLREADTTLRLWDTDSRKVVYSEVVSKDARPLLEFLSDTTLLRVDPPGTLSIRRLPEGSAVWSANVGGVTAMTLAADGRRVAASFDRPRPTVRAWDVANGRVIFEQPLQASAGDLVFDRSGRYLAVLSGYDFVPSGLPNGVGVTVWDVAAKRGVVALPKSERIIALDFSADGEQFAALGYTGELKLWNLVTGETRRTVTADPGPLAFSGTGRWIAVGNRSIRVLETSSLRPLAQLDIGGEIRAIEFRSGDALIAARRFDSGATKGVVEIHRWRTADMLAEACRRMPLAAAERQWKQLLPTEPLPSPCAKGTAAVRSFEP